jgi:hypothetical protein
MELGEFLMKMIQIGALSVGILSLIVNSMAFSGTVETFTDQKVAIDFSYAVLSAPCFVYDVYGDGRTGLFDFDKLSSARQSCVHVDGQYYYEILSSGNPTYKFGRDFEGGQTISVPVLIRKGVDQTDIGKIDIKVKIERGGLDG